MRVLATMFLSLSLLWPTSAVWPTSAAAQDGPGQWHPHAIPPLPYSLISPMPSLPPPGEIGTEDPLPVTAGRVIQRPGFDALLHEDGRLMFDSRFLRTMLDNDPAVGPRFSASFDLSDMLTNFLYGSSGYEPYASAKLELLHETFAMRVELREANNELLMSRALAALPDYLEAVWAEESWDAQTRRHLLFALWDECVEDGNTYLREGGQAARHTIESFIRRKLPTDAYSEEELSALNSTRISSALFQPFQARSQAPGAY